MTIFSKLAALTLAMCVAAGCQNSPEVGRLGEPPVAVKRPVERSYHNRTLSDDYLWLKDQSYPVVDDEDILGYLRQENQWYEQQMALRQPLVNTLFEEMKGRVQEDQKAVPWEKDGYTYRWQYAPGSEYRLWERKPGGSDEYVTVLDESLEAAGQEFFSLGGFEISPDGRFLAWTADFDGSEKYRLVVDDLVTGKRVDEGVNNVSGGTVAWSADGNSLVYPALEDDGWYAQRVKVHALGTSPEKDKEIFFNPDRRLFLRLTESQSGKYALISLADYTRSEVYYLPLDNLTAKPELISPMRDGHLYQADHGNGRFYILTNDQHINFRLATAPEEAPGEENWQSLLPPSDDAYFKRFVLFRDFIAVEEMSRGLQRIRIVDKAGDEHYVAFPEAVYASSLGNNPDINADFLRIEYQSMIIPETVFDYRPQARSLDLRQRQEIPSGYDSSQYETTRLWAPARDGVKVPVSVVYKKGVKLDGTSPMVLYGYGAYASGTPPDFSISRLSLVDRGVVYAIAHVRGGDEMGRGWYLDGKLEKRSNTFNDFVDAARYLLEQGYGSQGNVAIYGESAGGELVGASVVQAPEFWGAAVLMVPFVDVLNTMLDESLPLTPPEWLEWGNPIESATVFDLISTYSPYDNIDARDYPPMMVTGGLNDPRVTYWEPAKWTAKMRALKTDNNELILKVDMGAGHQGRTGRYARLYEIAEAYAFVLTHLNGVQGL